MLVAASFLSSKDIGRDLRVLNDTDIDFIHVDVMDGKFVKNKTIPFKEMKNIYRFTSKRLDVHLMVKKVEKLIPKYAALNTEYITFHIVSGVNIMKCLELIKKYAIKCGLAISPETEVKELVPYLPLLDLILVMSVTPGAGGQEFIKSTKNKITELRQLLKEHNSNALISVDGGINNETVKYCQDADMVVAGSYIIKSDHFQEKIDSLR